MKKADADMVRIRIEAETVSLAQRETIERLSRDYGDGAVQTISSQALQMDDIPVASVSTVLDALARVGFVPQSGGEKPAHRVAPCVRAGACPRERFDVTPYAIAVAAYSRQSGRSRLKIAFSGCPSDCALACAADLGFLAQCQEGAEGFSVYVGGTSEPNPAVGVKIETFIGADEVFVVVEALMRLFDQQRCPADGLRDVIDRMGPGEFTRRYREQRAALAQTDCGCIVLTSATPA